MKRIIFAAICLTLLLAACAEQVAPASVSPAATPAEPSVTGPRTYLKEAGLTGYPEGIDIYAPFSGPTITEDDLMSLYRRLESVSASDIARVLSGYGLQLTWSAFSGEGVDMTAYLLETPADTDYTILRIKETVVYEERCLELIFKRNGGEYMPHSAIVYIPYRSEIGYFSTIAGHTFYITQGEGVTGTGHHEDVVAWYNVDTMRTEFTYTYDYYTETHATPNSISCWSFKAEEAAVMELDGGAFTLAFSAQARVYIDYFDDNFDNPDEFETQLQYVIGYDPARNAFYCEGDAGDYLLGSDEFSHREEVWISIFRNEFNALRQAEHPYPVEVAEYYLDGVVVPRPERTPDTPNSSANITLLDTPIPQKLKDAIALNSDVIGWIEIPDTGIDAPILYSANWFYSDHNIHKEPDEAGCIYTYYNMLTRNVIVQGRNMRKAKQVFHGLHKLQDNKELLKERENRLCNIRLFGFEQWEIFALYETTSDEPAETLRYNYEHMMAASETEVEAWIATQKERSELRDIIDVPVSGDDVLMTLITGGDHYEHEDTQSRLYVFLKGVG